MHNMSNAKFVYNVWKLVVDPKTDDIIRWSKDGRKIIIIDRDRFVREILPLHFKHRNFSSFIRQLNFYRFTKKRHGGKFDFEPSEMQIYHPSFRRNCAHLLENIKKKTSNDKLLQNSEGDSFVPDDLKVMRDSFESKISELEEGNNARQRELHSLREKCVKHEEIVEKLLQFIGSQESNERTKTNKASDFAQQLLDNWSEESASEPVIKELDKESNGNESVLRDPLSPCESLVSIKSSHSDSDDAVPTQVAAPTEDPVPTDCSNPLAISLSFTFDFSNAVLNPLAGSTSASTVINAVNSDGSHIVYHVTDATESVTPTPKTATNSVEVLKPDSTQNKLKSDSMTSKLSVAKFLPTNVNSQQKKITPTLGNNRPSSCFAKTSYMDLTTVSDPTVISPQTEKSTKQVAVDPLSVSYVGDLSASDMSIELFEEAPTITDDADLVSNGHCKVTSDCQPRSSLLSGKKV